MKPTVITFKTDPDTKHQAKQIAEEMGVSVSAVLNALLKDFIRTRTLSIHLPEENLTQDTKQWLTTTVIHGDKTGRTIGFPTANLDIRLMDPTTQHGVWAVKVKHHNNTYLGALYYGPRLVKNEKHLVLEVHILDFDQEIYGDQLWFQLLGYVREVMDFESLDELKQQLSQDVKNVTKIAKTISFSERTNKN